MVEGAPLGWAGLLVSLGAVAADLDGEADQAVAVGFLVGVGGDCGGSVSTLLLESRLLLLEQIEGDGVRVVGLEELELLGFESSEAGRGILRFAFRVRALFAESVEEAASDARSLVGRDVDPAVVVEHRCFDVAGPDMGLLAAVTSLSSGAEEVGVAPAVPAASEGEQQPGLHV